MSSAYCVRLYKFHPATNAALATSSPQLADVYGPISCLAGWAAAFNVADSFSEQLVSMSDPNGNNQISNVSAIDFRCGLPTEGDRDVVYAGLVAASSLGATRNSLAAGATPLSVVALPGGRVRVAGAGRYSVAPGALIFQL